MNDKSRVGLRDYLIVGTLLLLLLLVGSFYDYQISLAIYNENNLPAGLMAGWGQYPQYLISITVGVLLIRFRNPDKKWLCVVEVILGLETIGFSVRSLLTLPYNSTPSMPMPDSIISGIVIGAAVVILVLLCARKSVINRKQVIILCICLMVMKYLNWGILDLIKEAWQRPRMRLLAGNNTVFFQPWYVKGCSVRDALVASGVSSEEFRSFPSGHTSDAAMAMIAYFIAGLGQFRKNRKLVFYLSLIWPVTVAFTRIIMGAHFLTDVTVGFAVSFMLFIAANEVLSFIEKRQFSRLS